MKTKKLVVIAASIVVIAIVAFSKFSSLHKENLQKQYLKETVAKGDSAIMTEFLKGNTALNVYALKSANSVWQEYCDNTSLMFSPLNRHPLSLETVRQALYVVEQVHGSDSLASMLYKYKKFDCYILGNKETGRAWNMRIDLLMLLLSEPQKRALQKIVLTKNEDPFWVQRYVSNKEIKDRISKGLFDRKKAEYFLLRSSNISI